MKSLYVFTAVLLVASPAFAWKKVVECQEGQAVLDRFSPAQTSSFYQIVIREEEAIEHFRVSNAVSSYRFTSQGEMILPLGLYDGKREFSGDSDANQRDGRIYYVHVGDGGLQLSAYQTTPRIEGDFDIGPLLAQWYFSGCQRTNENL